jgi:hypothetical protein
MKSPNVVPVDYAGVYITRVEPAQREIIMADNARFKGTSSEMVFEKIDGRLKLAFHGLFEERPITMTTMHTRADIYMNIKNRQLAIQIIENLFNPKLLSKEELPQAPDPRMFVGGITCIPRREAPATMFPADLCRICTPRWKIKSRHIQVYLDIEYDKELGREQVHLGITGFQPNDLNFLGKNVPIGKIVNAVGCVETNILNANILYSYLVHYAIL